MLLLFIITHMHRKWNLSSEGRSNFHIVLKQYWGFFVWLGFLYNLLKTGIARAFSHISKTKLCSNVLKHWCETHGFSLNAGKNFKRAVDS